MRLPKWLRSHPAPPPSAALPRVPVGEAPDPDARIHIAAHDPDFPRKREVAVDAICAAIEAVAGPAGYNRIGTTWTRQTDIGKTAVHLQRSRYGFDATVILRFLPKSDRDLRGSIWNDETDIPLARFFPPADADPSSRPSVIYYLDVYDDPASLAQPMRLLEDRALPWLDAHHHQDKLPDFPASTP
jgi:hypothetical protein